MKIADMDFSYLDPQLLERGAIIQYFFKGAQLPSVQRVTIAEAISYYPWTWQVLTRENFRFIGWEIGGDKIVIKLRETDDWIDEGMKYVLEMVENKGQSRA